MITLIIIYLIIGAIPMGIELYSDLKWVFTKYKSELETPSDVFWFRISLTLLEGFRSLMILIGWPIFAVVKIREMFKYVL